MVLEALRIDLVNVFGPGGSGGEPAVGGDDLQTADRRVVAWSARQLGRDRFPGQFRLSDCRRRQLQKPRLLFRGRRGVQARVERHAELLRQFPIVLTRVFACSGGDLGRQQVHDGAVLVGRPHTPVVPQETGSGTFLAAKANRALEQTRREPLEADRHFAKLSASFLHHTVDHAAADQRLADGDVRGPVGTMGE